ncbi:MAG: septation protein SpoVG family protein [Planctomycetes bacterium]|nr:septation protein SpoVG family protein [Planctomycetota bacterium]MBI3844110.1 septation protein SpoVG family protein [Planctomycetota bacterium]
MEITEVRIKLIENRRDKLQAFCSITLDDDFVIRDLKIIGGAHGAFVAMPSRKLADRCGRCGGKNHLRAAFCNDCGASLAPNRASKDERGRARLHADIAHPVHAACRERFQKRILDAFHREVERSHEPGYVPQELHPLPDLDDFDVEALEEPTTPFRGRPVIESRSNGVSEKASDPRSRAAGMD